MGLESDLQAALLEEFCRRGHGDAVQAIDALNEALRVVADSQAGPLTSVSDADPARHVAARVADVMMAWVERHPEGSKEAVKDCRRAAESLISRLGRYSEQRGTEAASRAEDSVGNGALESGRRAAGKLLADLFKPRGESVSPSMPETSSGTTPSDLPEGFGDYELLAEIGSGGMGTVYLARQISLGREVALKLLSHGVSRNPRALERFLREAKAAAQVEHPSIVPVFDAGIDNGRPFIAMQFVRGISLQEVLSSGGRLEVRRALEMIRDISHALQAAHERGIVHRDVKPGNILIEGDARSARLKGSVYLTDFGLAMVGDGDALTRTGEILGTPAYMSPEQARGVRADRASDIYSLGATFYALLAGRAPHEGSNYAELLARVAHEDPVPLRKLIPALDREATLICENAMRWDPKRRYGSAAELADDIERRLDRRPIRARPASWSYRASLWLKRNPRLVNVAVLVLLFALMSFVVERVWRKKAILEAVNELVASHEYRQAEGKLDNIPWLPWFSGKDEEMSLRLQVHVAKANLNAAVRAAGSLSTPLRESAYAELRTEVDQVLHDAEVLMGAGMWRSALRDVWNAAGGIEALEEISGLPACPPGWTTSRAERAAYVGLTGLLDRGHDLFAVRLLDEEENGFSPAVTRKVLEEALGVSQEVIYPRMLEADTLLARLIEQEFRPFELTGSPRDERQAHLSGFFRVLDQYMPRLPLKEIPRAKRQVEILQCLEAFGSALPIKPAAVDTTGDVDGDGLPDLVTGVDPNEIQVLEWAADGLRVTHEFEIEQGPGGEEVKKIDALALHDLDGDNADEIIVFYRLPNIVSETCRGCLRAYTLKAGTFIPFGEVFGPLEGCLPTSPQAIAVCDSDGDGRLELLVGTSSSGEDERQVWLIRHPFTSQQDSFPLPSAGEESDSDVEAVFAGDFDGDEQIEVGCVTGRWKEGFDIRFWKFDAVTGKYRGPLRYGPLGTFERALPVELDGQPPLELVLAKSSYSFNEEHFPEPPHTGLKQGVYVFRIPPGQAIGERDIRTVPERPQKTFLWFDSFTEKLDDPWDRLGPESLSVGQWSDGRIALAVSWSLRKGNDSTHFVDLYLQRTEPLLFTRSRLFWRRGQKELRANLVRLPGQEGRPTMPGLILLEGEANSKEEWRALTWTFTPPPELAPVTTLRKIEAYTRAERYGTAVHLARAGLAGGPSAREAVMIALAWARAAGRSLQWQSMTEALGKLDDFLRSGTSGVSPGEPDNVNRERGILEKVARQAIRLSQQRPEKWSGDFAVDLKQSLDSREPKQRSSTLHVLKEKVTLSGPSDIQLSFEVDIKRLGWNRNVFVGLCPTNGRWKHNSYGVNIQHSGGVGQELREAGIRWNGHLGTRTDPRKLLEEGQRYHCVLVRTSEGRILLKVEKLIQETAQEPPGSLDLELSGQTSFFWTYPEYDLRKPLSDDVPSAEQRQRVQALAPPREGGYQFAIVDMNKGAQTTTRLTIRNIELRIVPAGELAQE